MLAPEIARLRSERETKLAVIKKERQSLKVADQEAIKRVADMEAELPAIPNLPCLFTGDITSERLETMLAEQTGRVAIISDEGGLFDVLAGRYNEKLNLDVFLKGHAGTPVRVHRITREPVIVDDPALTVMLSPQPGCLSELRDKSPLRNRGLLTRVLYALPPSPVGGRRLDPVPIPSGVVDAYENIMQGLLETHPSEASRNATRP